MKNDLENFIRHNRDSFDRKTPDQAVLGRLLQQMQPKDKPAKKGILIPLRILVLAAACVVLGAFALAFWALRKPVQTKTIAKTNIAKPQTVKKQPDEPAIPLGATANFQTGTGGHKKVDEVDQDLALRRQVLLAKLKLQSLHSEKRVMFASLNNMESPAGRIAAVSDAYKLKNTGNDIVNALVETLNTDPNINVRLAALDGLGRFYRDDYVRKKLIASLKKQNDPLVQIALINLLTRMRESGILSELDKIVNDENTQKPVRDCAYSDIIQLKSS